MGPVYSAFQQENHPRIIPAAPYEEYQRYLSLSAISERTAEWKLYFGEVIDRAGITIDDATLLAEPAARRVLSDMPISDPWDWPAVIDAFRTRTKSAVEQELQP